MPIFVDAHQGSKMICKVSSLKSRIKSGLYFEEIITYSTDVFKDCESDITVGI